MRLIAKVDANQALIVEALRRVGAHVACTHQLGGGFPDLVVSHWGKTYLVECKMPGASLTPDEARFHDEWAGYVHIVTTPEQAIELVTSPPERQGEWWYS